MDSNKFSVVQIIDRLHTGGAEHVVVHIANLLHIHGHKVTVLTTVSEGPLRSKLAAGIPFTNLKRKWKWNPVTMYRLIQAIKPFDIIHVHSSFNLRYLFLASKIFGLKKPIFFHEHFGDININQSASWHQRYIYPQAILIAVSKQIADWAIQKVHINSNRVFVLPNIILKEDFLTSNRLQTGQKHLVVVANFRPTKNIGFAIECFAQLCQTVKTPLHLTIIGQIADSDYYQSIQQLITEKNLAAAITLITDCSAVQPLLPNFDLALHTSTSESGPLALIEYMAQQLPFLTYHTGEVVQQIKNELPKMIIDNFDIAQWVQQIESLLQPEGYALLQQKLQQVFEKHYSAEQYYNRCIEIYSKGLKFHIF